MWAAALRNTIVANNSANTGGNCNVAMSDGGYNLQFNPNTAWGFALAPGDAKLAPLANYGGSTQTMALMAGSAAIDAVIGNANCPSNDQRGVARPQDGDLNGSAICDIGAFEATIYPIFFPLIEK